MMTATMKAGYLPKHERKNILLLSDDLRLTSGVGVMSREIVLKTAHHFNWIQLGAALQHPEHGKVVDLSQSVNAELGIPDSYVRVYPYTGYGDQQVLRYLLKAEKIDAVLHFTDPRFWIWLYQLEHEVRQQCPLLFYHIWDSLPYPKYNTNYYRSCDWIGSISKQTFNIVRQLTVDEFEPWQYKYIPHGVDITQFRKLDTPEELAQVDDARKRLFGDDDVQFVVLYNNRNIRRKMTGDVILAYRKFLLGLPENARNRCRLLMHTQPVDENGTDLVAVIRDCAPEIKVVFSTDRIDTPTLNRMLNLSDVVINLASAEGFGLGTLEAIAAERMIVANVTGGLQDQMGFVND